LRFVDLRGRLLHLVKTAVLLDSLLQVRLAFPVDFLLRDQTRWNHFCLDNLRHHLLRLLLLLPLKGARGRPRSGSSSSSKKKKKKKKKKRRRSGSGSTEEEEEEEEEEDIYIYIYCFTDCL
jgi:hypothetical protein